MTLEQLKEIKQVPDVSFNSKTGIVIIGNLEFDTNTTSRQNLEYSIRPKSKNLEYTK